MSSSEKRRHIRIKALNLSHIDIDDSDATVKQGMGRTLNVSQSGILLETPFALETGQMLKIALGLEDEVLEVAGSVIYAKVTSEGRWEAGVKFDRPPVAKVAALGRYIDAFRRASGSGGPAATA